VITAFEKDLQTAMASAEAATNIAIEEVTPDERRDALFSPDNTEGRALLLLAQWLSGAPQYRTMGVELAPANISQMIFREGLLRMLEHMRDKIYPWDAAGDAEELERSNHMAASLANRVARDFDEFLEEFEEFKRDVNSFRATVGERPAAPNYTSVADGQPAPALAKPEPSLLEDFPYEPPADLVMSERHEGRVSTPPWDELFPSDQELQTRVEVYDSHRHGVIQGKATELDAYYTEQGLVAMALMAKGKLDADFDCAARFYWSNNPDLQEVMPYRDDAYYAEPLVDLEPLQVRNTENYYGVAHFVRKNVVRQAARRRESQQVPTIDTIGDTPEFDDADFGRSSAVDKVSLADVATDALG